MHSITKQNQKKAKIQLLFEFFVNSSGSTIKADPIALQSSDHPTNESVNTDTTPENESNAPNDTNVPNDPNESNKPNEIIEHDANAQNLDDAQQQNNANNNPENGAHNTALPDVFGSLVSIRDYVPQSSRDQ